MTSFEKKRKEVVQYLIKNNVLVTGDILTQLQHEDVVDRAHQEVRTGHTHTDVIGTLKGGVGPSRAQRPSYSPTSPQSITPSVHVLYNYTQKKEKLTVDCFVNYFNHRYKALEMLLRQRQELKSVLSVRRLQDMSERSQVALIGLVYEKSETKNGNIALTLEDQTGTCKVIFTKHNEEVFARVQDVMIDEVIGITGNLGNGVVFGSTVIHPDVPLGRERKRSPDDACVAFISDLHIGSNLFCEKSLSRFVDWLAGTVDFEQELAKKVKYVIVVGDVVDSVGVYPNQESELTIQDIYEQFRVARSYFERIPQHIQIIMCPGNHEPTRIAEPQPKMDKEFAQPLYDLPNVTMVTNPALVTIHSSPSFPGFDVLLYHGYSYTHYGDVVHSIRTSGKNVSDRIELIMKYILQRRHLAPSYGSNQFIPDSDHDPMVIARVPDIFCSGHIHKSHVSTYRGVTLVSGSCFQEMSSYQEKFGHVPDPGKVPILHLHTGKAAVVDFYVG